MDCVNLGLIVENKITAEAVTNATILLSVTRAVYALKYILALPVVQNVVSSFEYCNCSCFVTTAVNDNEAGTALIGFERRRRKAKAVNLAYRPLSDKFPQLDEDYNGYCRVVYVAVFIVALFETLVTLPIWLFYVLLISFECWLKAEQFPEFDVWRNSFIYIFSQVYHVFILDTLIGIILVSIQLQYLVQINPLLEAIAMNVTS